MEQNTLSGRALLTVVLTGLILAVVAVGVAAVALSFNEPRYRAEMQLALLPGPLVPPEELADYWEVLSAGQAARIGAEVLGQRRWLAPIAQAAGVGEGSIRVTSGAVGDTSLINVAVEAESAQAAERAAYALFREARPLVEQVSRPFVLEVVQPAAGTAAPTGPPRSQLLAVVGAAGLLIGSGVALLVVRHQAAGSSAPDKYNGRSDEEQEPAPTAGPSSVMPNGEPRSDGTTHEPTPSPERLRPSTPTSSGQ